MNNLDWDWLKDNITITIYKMPDGSWAFAALGGVYDYFPTLADALDKVKKVVLEFQSEVDGG